MQEHDRDAPALECAADPSAVDARGGAGSLLGAIVCAALEEIPAPAFVVERGGRLVHLNAAGRALLASDLEVVRAALAPAAGSPDPAFFHVKRVAVPAVPDHYLCVRRMLHSRASVRAEWVGRRWRLTPKQTAVLARLALGATNREVARALSCAESTIEQHVTVVLEKSLSGCRAELLARFWAD